MVVSDVGKMAGLATFTIGLFILVAASKIEFSDATPFLTLILGYLVGNGLTAVRKHAPSAVLMPRMESDQIITVEGPRTAPTGVRIEEDDAWPEPETHRFFTDENGDL